MKMCLEILNKNLKTKMWKLQNTEIIKNLLNKYTLKNLPRKIKKSNF